MKIKVVMCEGAHDIGFISKILLANGYKAYEKKVKDYPFPLNKYIMINMKKEQVADKKLGFSVSCYVPYACFEGNGTLFLFHSMGGDGTTNERKTIMNEYFDILNEIKSRTITNSDIDSIDFYMFFDSDDMGIDKRVDDIKATFAGECGIDTDKLQHGEKAYGEEISLGIYIFHDVNDPDKKGTLEDHIISLFKNGNEKLLDGAYEYLQKYKLIDERTKEYHVESDKHKGPSKFNKKKSIISVAGQLQFSGMNNSVIIMRTDYMTKADICSDAECKKILELLEK